MADNKTQIVITAKDETRAAIESAKRGLQSLEKTAVGLGPIFAGLGAALSFGSLANTITNTIKFAAALDDMAESTGASVENLSALAGVAKVGGHDLGMVEGQLQKLAKALHATDDESKGAALALEAIGLSAEKLRNMDTAEAMLEVAKALAQFEDGSGKTAVAIALLGKSGAQALPFLKDLADTGELVGKVTAEQAAQAEQYEKNLNRLASSFSAAGKAAAYELLPLLEKITGEMLQAREEAGSFSSMLGGAFRTALETVAILGVNVAYVFRQVGEEIGGIAAQIAALGRLDFKAFSFINEDMKERAAAARKEVDRLSESLLNRDKAPAAEPEKKKSLAGFVARPPAEGKARAAGGGRSQIDQAARLIEQLDEQIALKKLDAESTDKMSAAEQQRAKVLYQLDAGTIKATASQRAKIIAALDELVVLDQALKAQKEYADALERQEQANIRARDQLVEQTAAAQKAADLYGLTEAQIAAVAVARLEDARAMAEQNGAYPEQLAFLDEEIARRKELADALDKVELKRLLAGTPTAEAKKLESDVARLDRAKASGQITTQEYDEAIAKLKEDTSEIGEFAKQAARNMQDAMAELFINPTKDGIKGFADSFSQALQKMIAQAGAAQLFKLLLGDKFDKTGDVGGWLGDILKSFGIGKGSASASAAAAGASSVAGAVASGGTSAPDMSAQMAATTSKMADSLNKTMTDMASTIGDMLAKITSGIGDLVSGLVKALSDLMSSIVDALGSVDWGGLFKGIASAFEFRNGGIMTPRGPASLHAFADGGIMTSAGPLPLNRYSSGGVASRPQMALFGEGRKPEAYVPLADGRSIPVEMRSAPAPVTINLDDIKAPGDPASVDPIVIKQLWSTFVRQSVTRQQFTVPLPGGRQIPATMQAPAGMPQINVIGEAAGKQQPAPAPFAAGGIMTPSGPLPLRMYASGGIADRPQVAVFGEGAKPEAFVPLPDGKRIPVQMRGASGDVVVKVLSDRIATPEAKAIAERFQSLNQVIDGRSFSRSVTIDNAIVNNLQAPAASHGAAPAVSSFAAGGIMTDHGVMPLHSYATGGIASTPQMAIFGEGRMPEAFVPLPNGKQIPVEMKGGGSNITVNVNSTTGDAAEIRRAAAAGARTALGFIGGAKRYG